MNNEFIILKGCKENNLKNISLKIPKRKRRNRPSLSQLDIRREESLPERDWRRDLRPRKRN